VDLFQFLKQFYTLSFVWLTLLTALFMYSKATRPVYRAFLLFIIVMAVAETAGNFMAYKKIHNHFYFNIFYLIQFIAIPLFYYYNLQSPFLKKIIITYFIVFPLFVFMNIASWQNFNQLLTHSFVFGGCMILVLAIAYIWQLYISDDTQSIWHYPWFWISLAYLFYYTVSVPYIGMLNYLWLYDPGFTKKYYFVFNIIIILHNSLLITGFIWMKAQPMKQQLS